MKSRLVLRLCHTRFRNDEHFQNIEILHIGMRQLPLHPLLDPLLPANQLNQLLQLFILVPLFFTGKLASHLVILHCLLLLFNQIITLSPNDFNPLLCLLDKYFCFYYLLRLCIDLRLTFQPNHRIHLI